jgi:hypothetical protein
MSSDIWDNKFHTFISSNKKVVGIQKWEKKENACWGLHIWSKHLFF